jgi:hypothetical protein
MCEKTLANVLLYIVKLSKIRLIFFIFLLLNTPGLAHEMINGARLSVVMIGSGIRLFFFPSFSMSLFSSIVRRVKEKGKLPAAKSNVTNQKGVARLQK